MLRDIDYVLRKLDWMRAEQIWPNGRMLDGQALAAEIAQMRELIDETWRAGDEYDKEAITWVMACTSHLPGAFLTRRSPLASETGSII